MTSYWYRFDEKVHFGDASNSDSVSSNFPIGENVVFAFCAFPSLADFMYWLLGVMLDFNEKSLPRIKTTPEMGLSCQN